MVFGMTGGKKVIEMRSALQRRSVGAEILARTIATRQRVARRPAVRLIVDLARMTRTPQA